MCVITSRFYHPRPVQQGGKPVDPVHARFKAMDAERDRLRNARTYGDDVSDLYGNATLRTRGVHPVADLASPDGDTAVPIGDGLVWRLNQLQGHAVTFGATRSGKGVSSIIPTLLSYAGPIATIDPKGENAWATMERRKAMGQRVVILDHWGEIQRRYGDKATPPVQVETSKFNPLAALDPTSEDFADDVAAIADALVIPGLGEAHWTDSAREMVAGLVALCCELSPGHANLGDVRKLITADPADLVAAIKGAVEANPESLGGRKLSRFTNLTNEVQSVRSVALTQTAILDSRRLVDGMTTDANPFDLAELGTGSVTLYLVLPLDRLETHGRWLRLIITMAIRAIAKLDKQPTAPVLFILDEMGTIGPLRMVEQAFGLMAGVGIRISAYLQDLKQLQRDYPASWETFISNASLIQALKVTDATTSDYLSNLMGTTTRLRYTADTMALRSGNKLPWGAKGDPTASTAGDLVMSRALLLPQEVREGIGPDRVLAILPGVGNYLVDRMPYYAPTSIWRGLYRSPPWFAAANAAAPIPAPRPGPAPASSPTPARPGARRPVFAWFSDLSTRAKVGVGAGGVFGLFLLGHFL